MDLADNTVLMGRELFEPLRKMVGPAEEGASIFGPAPLHVPDSVDTSGGYTFPKTLERRPPIAGAARLANGYCAFMAASVAASTSSIFGRLR